MKVVLISVDTLRADHLGAYGYPLPTTPHMDELARTGALFERHYATDVPTPGSYTAMLTGARGQRTGIFGFGHTNYAYNRSIPLVSTLLAEEGHATCAISNLLYSCPWLTAGFHEIYPPGLRFQGGTADEVTGLACDWLDRHHHQEFFLFAHYWDPHVSYFKRAPERYVRKFREFDYSTITPDPHYLNEYPVARAVFEQYAQMGTFGETDFTKIIPVYDACVHYADEGVGRLAAHLAKLGIEEETLLIVTSDHGEAFGERGFFDHTSCYHNVSRVPLIVRWPRRVNPARVAGYSDATDLVPTILDLADLEPSTNLSGKSLEPVLTEGAATPREQVVTNGAAIPIQRMYVEDGWALVHTMDNPVYDYIKTYELFCIDEDPAQEQDRSGDEPERLAGLKARYEAWLEAELDGMPDRLAGLVARGGWGVALMCMAFYAEPELIYARRRHRELIDAIEGAAARRFYREKTGRDPEAL